TSSHLCANLCGTRGWALPETVTYSSEERIAAAFLFRGRGDRPSDDHSHRPPRWNPQRGRNTVRRLKAITSSICRTIRRPAPIDRPDALGRERDGLRRNK